MSTFKTFEEARPPRVVHYEAKALPHIFPNYHGSLPEAIGYEKTVIRQARSQRTPLSADAVKRPQDHEIHRTGTSVMLTN